jgi:hypothetical protein
MFPSLVFPRLPVGRGVGEEGLGGEVEVEEKRAKMSRSEDGS